MVILIGLTFLRQYHSSRPEACGAEKEKRSQDQKKKKK